MEARVVPLGDLGAREESAWRALASRAVDPNPMSEPGFVLAAARHLPYGSDIELVVAEEGGRFHGAMPVRRLPRQPGVPLPVATTDIRRMTYLGTPLLDERGVEAARHLISAVGSLRRRRRWMFLVVRWIGAGDAEAMLRAAAQDLGLPLEVLEDFDQPFLVRRSDGDYTRHQSKRHLSDYRRRAKRLAEAAGGELAVVDRGSDPAAVEEYIAMEGAGYKHDRGIAMVTQPGEAEYFRAMCQRFAADGRLHVLCLEAAGRTIAMQVSVEASRGLFLVKVGHDEAFARFDPGVQLHLRAMEFFHSQTTAEWIDVCTFPGNELLLRLYPDRRRTMTLLIGLGGPLNDAAAQSLPFLRQARSRLVARRPGAGRATTGAG